MKLKLVPMFILKFIIISISFFKYKSRLQIKFIKLNIKIVTLMKEPTTIPQYKQFCKALKLKILKQKTTIESQTQQIQRLNSQIKILKKSGLQLCNENDPIGTLLSSARLDKTKNNLDNVDLQSLQGKHQVMNKFKSGATSFGITPQSIFRIADFTYKNEVEADYFRQVLAKIDLGLTQMEISCLIYIFDENCTGFIHRDDFNDSLNAYQVSLEQSHLHYISACLEKLAKFMSSDKIDVTKFFQQMQGRNFNSVDMNRFYEKIKATFDKRLQTRQIMGSFHAIDLENDGIISKKNFIYSVTAAINKLSNQSNIKKSNSFDEVNNHLQKSQVSNKKVLHNTGGSIIQNNKQDTNISKIFKDAQIAQQIISKLQNTYKLTLNQIYEQICQTPLIKRLTLFQFKKVLSQISEFNKIDPQVTSQLFKAIDFNQKGSIHYGQLIRFYLMHENDMSIIFHLIGIYFKNNGLNAWGFWFLCGITQDSDISKSKFLEVMSKNFGNTNQIWQKVWNYFDKGRGVVAVSQINKELKKYQMDS